MGSYLPNVEPIEYPTIQIKIISYVSKIGPAIPQVGQLFMW